MKDKPFQALRSRSTTDQVAKILTQVDPKTGEPIVLWRDIKVAFKNAESIWDGDFLVPFLTEENSLELCDPLRIAYHPDNVLVVTEDTGQVSHSRETSSFIETLAVGGGSKDHDPGRYFQSSTGTTDVATLTRTVEAFEIADTNTHNQSLLGYSACMPQDTQLILAQSQPLNHHLQVMSGQTTVATIMQSLGQIQEMQTKMDEKQTKMDEKQSMMDEKQDNMLQMQRQALDRLVIIQNSVQALVTQTYELHEYPIPRLFIVLPKAVGVAGKLKGVLSDQFRLYFLCECGTHTMTEDTKTPHHIHLAKHDGYDLEKPSVFFERYGKYVLTLMQMIKYGVTAAGVIVPPLASSGILDGLDMAQKHMDYIKKNIGSLVDDAIKFLDDINTNNGMGDELAASHTGFDQLEALEGADLRQLESYLKVKDQGRVLGNLYRIVTSEGHVKWVCFDHYRASYRETAMKHLREVVEVNRGTYIEEIGRIKIEIGSSILARQFYDAMTKARWIQELEITLEWDATMDDLRTLANAVTKANVIRLTVDGSHLKSPALDVINRTRRYDPIMKLASNHRIQSLQFQGFENFFSRVSKSSLAPSPKLRMFSMRSGGLAGDKAANSFDRFIKQCSALTSVELQLRQQPCTARGMEGKIHEMDMTSDRVDGLDSDDLKVIREHHLTKLAIKYAPQEADERKLIDILRHSPLLSHLQIGCKDSRFHAIINLVVSTRERIVQERGSCSLRTFELMEENLTPFDVLANCDEYTHMQSHVTFPEGSDSFDMRTWIRLEDWMNIKDEDAVYDFVRQYGWSIVFFDEQNTSNNTFAAILDDIPNTRTSQLESLWIRLEGTADSGLNRLNEIIERSPNFKDLGLYVNLDNESQFTMAQSCLPQHGTVLSKLELYGNSSSERWSWITSTFPTRNSFPSLVSLEIWPKRANKLPSTFLSWIMAMVSAPPRGLKSHSPTQSLPQNVVDERSTHQESKSTGSWTPLRKIMLRNVYPQAEEWKALIEAIDFSALECLNFRWTNFSQEQFKLLMDHIPGDNLSKVRLRTFDIVGTDLVEETDSQALEAMFAELRMKAPLIDIITK